MKKKTILILSISIVSVLLIFLGSSYAMFAKTEQALKNNEYTTGILQITYNDTGSLDIGKLPLSDTDGKKTAPYTFTIKNTGNIDYQFDLKLVTDTTYVNTHGCANNQVPSNYIKVMLGDNGTPVLLSSLTNSIIAKKQIIAAGETRTYNLRLWLDTTTPNSVIGTHFHGKITTDGEAVYTEEGEEPNAPALAEGMIPIKWNGTTWVKADSTNKNNDWYNYSNKEWANAVMVANNSAYEDYLSDTSSNGFDAKLVNGAHWVKVDGENAIELDGVDDYIELPTLPSTIDFAGGYTVEVTMKWKTLDKFARIMDFGNGSGSDNLVIANWGSTPYIAYYNGTANINYPYFSLTLSKNVKETYKFELIKGSEYYTLKTYLNGTLKTTNSDKITVGAFRNIERTKNYIGKSNWNNPYLNAYIYNFKISDSNGNVIVSYDANNDIITKYTGNKTRNDYINANTGIEIPEDDILAYYVWIPRYKYRLFNVNSESIDPIEIQTVFESKNASKSTGSTNGEWLTHPAFTFGTDELSGIWVGKFETSGTANMPTIKPNLNSLVSQTVSNQFSTSQKLGTNAYLTSNGVSQVDAHMMKNTEWGAVAYLKQSKYGLGATDIGNNAYRASSSPYYKAGCGPASETDLTSKTTTCTSYTSSAGVMSSTTGNVYGVYDMAGGAFDYVMGIMKTEDGTSLAYSKSGLSESILPLESKYTDVYSYGTSGNDFSRRMLGDATGETNGWYDDGYIFPNSSASVFLRGGNSSYGSGVGIYRFYGLDGLSYTDGSFRSVITNK